MLWLDGFGAFATRTARMPRKDPDGHLALRSAGGYVDASKGKTMVSRFCCTMKQGRNEQAWWEDVQTVAEGWRCTATSTRGGMWTQSIGREIVYLVAGAQQDVLGFATARPT